MEVATLLQIQGANRFRVEAYYRAANMLLALIKPAWQLYELEGPGRTGNFTGYRPHHFQGIATNDSRGSLAAVGTFEW